MAEANRRVISLAVAATLMVLVGMVAAGCGRGDAEAYSADESGAADVEF